MSGGRRSDLVLVGVAAVWGCSFLVTKGLVAPLGVLPVLALRHLGALLALAVVVALARVRVGRAELRWGLLLGLSQAAVLLLETAGVAGTSATNAGLLISTTLLLTPVLDGVLTRSWLPPRFFAAAGLAVLGVGLLTGGGWRAPSGGDLLVLAAAAVRAAHVCGLGAATRRASLDLVGLTTVQTAVGALLLTALDPAGLRRAVLVADGGQWAAVAFLALGCTVFAFLAQTWAVRATSPARAGLLLGTEPLWALAAGLLLAGEVLGPGGAVGAVLLLTATTWGRRVERRHREGPASGRVLDVPPTPRPA